MTDEEPTTLTPTEAGAFVAQWAEQHPVDLVELATRLDLDPVQSESLLRQAKGRIAMELWQHRRPQRPASSVRFVVVVAALVVGGSVGFIFGGCSFGSRRGSQAVLPVTIPAPAPVSSGSAGPVAIPHSLHFPKATEYQASHLGSMIANLTTGSSGVSPTTPIAKGSLVATEGRVSEPSTDVVRTGLINVDLTKRFKTAVPLDMSLEIITGNSRYFRKGETKKDASAAARIQERDIVTPMHEMLKYVFDKEFAEHSLAPQGGTASTVTFIVRIGRAHSVNQVSWDEENRANLVTMESSVKEPFYGMLAAPILQTIHMLGPRLFVTTP